MNWTSGIKFHMSDLKIRIGCLLGENHGSGVRKHLENIPNYILSQLVNPNLSKK